MAASAEEIERVYHERYTPFRRAVAAIVGDEERTHDAVQEGFARALAKRRQFRGGSLEAWIWRIVFREALDLRERPPVALEDDFDVLLVISAGTVAAALNWAHEELRAELQVEGAER